MAENNSSAPLKNAPMIEAFEAAYSRDWNDPAGDEIKEIWHRAWQAAVAAQAAPAAVAGLDHTAMHDALLWLRSALDCKDWHWSPEQRDCAELAYHASIAALPATEDSSAGDLAEPTDDEGISREDWLYQAERLYLAVGDTPDEARMCASYLYNEQDWDGFGGDDPIHAALNDVEGRGTKAEVQAEPVALQMCSELRPRTESEKAAYLAGVADGRMYAERDADTAPQAQPADALDAKRWRAAAHDLSLKNLALVSVDDYGACEMLTGDEANEAIDAAMAAAQEGGNASAGKDGEA